MTTWVQEQLALSQAPTLGAALAAMDAWALNGMPLSAPPAALLTPANAPAGVSFLEGNMPLFTPETLASGIAPPIVPPLTPANAPAGVTFLEGNMPIFADHGGGGPQ